MTSKIILHRFSVAALAVLFAVLVLHGNALLHAREQASSDLRHHAEQNTALAYEKGVEESSRATSSFWRTFIWENFPPESLGQPGPDPLSEAYQQNEWRPFFITSRLQLNEKGKFLLNRLNSLESEAIDPQPYKLDEISNYLGKLEQCRIELKRVDPNFKDVTADALSAAPAPQAQLSGNDSSSPANSPVNTAARLKDYQQAFQVASSVDTKLAAAFVRYAKELNPSLGEDLIKALTSDVSAQTFFEQNEPAPNYQALVAAYSNYRNLAAHVSQQPVNLSASPRHGESGSHIRDLQKRLQQENFYSGHLTGTYDTETLHAVKDFQVAHLIDPDGVIGQRTRDWIRVPFREKADMIAYSLKTMRQRQVRNESRYIRINIPQFQLEYYADGKIQEVHRIIVGKAGGKRIKFRGKMVGENHTPTLTSSIEQVIINPRWYVSDRIRIELNAEAKSDPEYFARHGYVQMASLYPWGQPRLYQRPGPKNALGRVKFEFPNIYAVYLHDTPNKNLFQRSRRDFSHGCIRVDKAVDLAQTLLRDDRSSYAEKVKSILDGDHQTFIRLAQPVPISIEYIPANVTAGGHVVFLGDPYGIMKENENGKA